MAHPEKIRKRSSFVVAAAVVAAFGCSSQSRTDEATAPEVGVSSDGILVCGTFPPAEPNGTPQTEWYSVIAMNNKLKHFPEFAATTGLSRVDTCSQARSFYKSYITYMRGHPRFDDTEPLEATHLVKPPVPNGGKDRPKIQVEKILNGVPDVLNPVVGLDNAGGHCSGTFIAKNWIMTAAHCLQTAPGWVEGQGQTAAKVHRWYQYAVSFAGPNGSLALVNLVPYVLQYFDPRYIGFSAPANSGAHIGFDFALLYVLDVLDDTLPNNSPNLSPNQTPFMRISLRNTITSSAAAWGWGAPGANTSRRAFLSQYNLVASPDVDLFGAFVPDAGGIPFMCKGDSGGPIVDRYDVLNPATGNIEIQPVAVAVFAAIQTNDPQCAQNPGDIDFWVRTREESDFIFLTVSDWYPGFGCTPGSAVGSGTADFLQCWGKPCMNGGDCGVDEVCVNPGPQLTTCTAACPPPGGPCDCIFGQCLPIP